jgi:4-hydroxythreonine-4-phosphate dehydrogenase
MEKNRKIRIGITHGDVNGVGYEVILKTFAQSEMFDLCIPVVYGSTKLAAYHRKALSIPTNFTQVSSAGEAQNNQLNIVNAVGEEVKVELGQATTDAGNAAYLALEKALEEYNAGLIDVLVTAPINKNTIQSQDFVFPGHTEYIEEREGKGRKALMILMNQHFRVAFVTGHVPLAKVPALITAEAIKEKIVLFNRSLKYDFGIDAPRIAVLSLNPHAGDDGLLGKEEEEVIIPAIEEMRSKNIICYGPYAVDGFMGAGNFNRFDGILAMYHDQGLAPFKALAMDEGVNFTAGLPIVRTSPAHGTAYDIAGKGEASESSFREAIYAAIDIFRRRSIERKIHARPLRKQYFDKKDDSDKLKLDESETEIKQ